MKHHCVLSTKHWLMTSDYFLARGRARETLLRTRMPIFKEHGPQGLAMQPGLDLSNATRHISHKTTELHRVNKREMEAHDSP